MATFTCLQYTYECSCGWRNQLDPFVVPALPNIPCPRCKAVAKAVKREVPYPFQRLTDYVRMPTERGDEWQEIITT